MTTTELVHVPGLGHSETPARARTVRAEREPKKSSPSAQAKHGRDLRRIQVMKGIASKMTYREMARSLGVSLATIAQDVKVVRRYWQVTMARDYDAMVREQEEILLELHRAVMPVALEGAKNGGPSMFAIDRELAILDRIARLKGLDAPTRAEAKVTVEHTTTLDAEIERLIAAMNPEPELVDGSPP